MGRRFRKKKSRRNKRYQRVFRNAAEDVVVWVCERWLAQRKISFYLQSWQNGQTDRVGIDVLIFLRSGLAVPAQVTFRTSEQQIVEKREHHFKLHPHVKTFVVVEKLPQGDVARDEKIYRKVAQDLAVAINKLAPAQDHIDPEINSEPLP